MTIRQSINRKRIRSLFFAGLPAWLAIVFAEIAHQRWMMWVGFFLLFVAAVYQLFGMRCSVCNGNLGRVLSRGVFVLGVRVFDSTKGVKFCPYCASDLDIEIQDLPCPRP